MAFYREFLRLVIERRFLGLWAGLPLLEFRFFLENRNSKSTVATFWPFLILLFLLVQGFWRHFLADLLGDCG